MAAPIVAAAFSKLIAMIVIVRCMVFSGQQYMDHIKRDKLFDFSLIFRHF